MSAKKQTEKSKNLIERRNTVIELLVKYDLNENFRKELGPDYRKQLISNYNQLTTELRTSGHLPLPKKHKEAVNEIVEWAFDNARLEAQDKVFYAEAQKRVQAELEALDSQTKQIYEKFAYSPTTTQPITTPPSTVRSNPASSLASASLPNTAPSPSLIGEPPVASSATEKPQAGLESSSRWSALRTPASNKYVDSLYPSLGDEPQHNAVPPVATPPSTTTHRLSYPPSSAPTNLYPSFTDTPTPTAPAPFDSPVLSGLDPTSTPPPKFPEPTLPNGHASSADWPRPPAAVPQALRDPSSVVTPSPPPLASIGPKVTTSTQTDTARPAPPRGGYAAIAGSLSPDKKSTPSVTTPTSQPVKSSSSSRPGSSPSAPAPVASSVRPTWVRSSSVERTPSVVASATDAGSKLKQELAAARLEIFQKCQIPMRATDPAMAQSNALINATVKSLKTEGNKPGFETIKGYRDDCIKEIILVAIKEILSRSLEKQPENQGKGQEYIKKLIKTMREEKDTFNLVTINLNQQALIGDMHAAIALDIDTQKVFRM